MLFMRPEDSDGDGMAGSQLASVILDKNFTSESHFPHYKMGYH